jgi:transposase
VGWWDIPSAEETEIPKDPHQDHADNFFDSQCIEHKEFVPDRKTEFYKGVMDRLLQRNKQVHPAAFCSPDLFLLHDNAPAHKAASVCQFLTQKNVTILYHPPYSPDLSPPEYFLFCKLKMKLKGLHFADVAEIEEVISDELKKVQKQEFLAAFQKLYNCAKACICANAAYFEFKKKGICLPHLSSIFKKISPKTFGLLCVF